MASYSKAEIRDCSCCLSIGATTAVSGWVGDEQNQIIQRSETEHSRQHGDVKKCIK